MRIVFKISAVIGMWSCLESSRPHRIPARTSGTRRSLAADYGTPIPRPRPDRCRSRGPSRSDSMRHHRPHRRNPASAQAPWWSSGAGAYPLGNPLQRMLTSDPSQAHPGEAALQRTCGAMTHVPVATQASAMRNPQRLPTAQSASVLHADPASLPVMGAHWHVSQPWASLRIPFGQLGRHPSAGHTCVGHDRICHPHVPSDAIAQTGPPVDPSGQMKLGVIGPGLVQTQRSPASPTAGHAGKSHSHWPSAPRLHTVRASDVPSGQVHASSGAPRPAQSVGAQSAPESTSGAGAGGHLAAASMAVSTREKMEAPRAVRSVPANRKRDGIAAMSIPLRPLAQGIRRARCPGIEVLDGGFPTWFGISRPAAGRRPRTARPGTRHRDQGLARSGQTSFTERAVEAQVCRLL